MDDSPVGQTKKLSNLRLIEAGFPCHQVGAETVRERDTGKAPPVNRLHVWWARRPLTPSRAAIVASLDPASTDPELFVRQLGIERVQALVNGEPWTLTSDLLGKAKIAESSSPYGSAGMETLPVDALVLRQLEAEQERRAENRALIEKLKQEEPALAHDPVLKRWEAESQALPGPLPKVGDVLLVRRVMGDPAWFKELMSIASANGIRVPNLYGYDRAFANPVIPKPTGLTILDPTAGGGSIPFEALRLGHNVIANELNPVATTILYATLDYPARFGMDLGKDIQCWGQRLLEFLDNDLPAIFERIGPLPSDEKQILVKHLRCCPQYLDEFNQEEVTTYLFVRQVTCPHCHGQAPLLNTMWLSKEAAGPWGVRVISYGQDRNGKVRFETYRVKSGKGANGEDPNAATVTRGLGQCVHCKQAIDGDEIKRQARGESALGKRLVNKTDEAVANPARDGGAEQANVAYERMMAEIFRECLRVLKDDGIMTLMFNHKSQEAWEALTKSLIEAGWTITASFPVESEGGYSTHQMNVAAAASSIFIACRKRTHLSDFPASWTGFGGSGVQNQVREAVVQGLREFEHLRLNPVDEMVACYGRALHVLSENWPVMDGDDRVTPIRAMNEASRVVAENQIRRITGGRLRVDDLDPETAMALTLYGIYGLYEFAYDEALNLSRSLNIALIGKPGGYRLEHERIIGINQQAGGRARSRATTGEESCYHAPLVRQGSKLRLARPEERSPRRLENPQTDWDMLHGLLQAYRAGDSPVARAYLEKHARSSAPRILDLLDVWAKEMEDEALRREAEVLHFGLRSSGS